MRKICIDAKNNDLLKEGMIYNVKIVSFPSFKEGFGIEIEELKSKHIIPFYLNRFKPCVLNLSPNIKIL